MTDAQTIGGSVLVLNKFYAPIHVTNVKRAFSLLCKQIAEVVAVSDGRFGSYDFESWKELSKLRDEFPPEDKYDWLHTISLEIRVPKIVRLLGYDRLPKKTVKFNRRNIYARDANRCQYCGKTFPTSELSLDHIVPRRCGGLSTWKNIVCACTACNVKKGGRRPVEASMRLIRQPVKPRRSPVLQLKVLSDKYRSWRHFVDEAYWNTELRD